MAAGHELYEVCAQLQKITPFAIQTTAHGNHEARIVIEAQLQILQEFYESKYKSIYQTYFGRLPSAIQQHVQTFGRLAKFSESVQLAKSDDYGNAFKLKELKDVRGEMYAICRNTEVRTQLETADGRSAMLHAITIPNFPNISITAETKAELVSAISSADDSLTMKLVVELGTEVLSNFLSETMQDFERTMEFGRTRLVVFCYKTEIAKNAATAEKCKQLPQTEKKYQFDIENGLSKFNEHPYIQELDYRTKRIDKSLIINALTDAVNFILQEFNSQVEAYIIDRQQLMYELTH